MAAVAHGAGIKIRQPGVCEHDTLAHFRRRLRATGGCCHAQAVATPPPGTAAAAMPFCLPNTTHTVYAVIVDVNAFVRTAREHTARIRGDQSGGKARRAQNATRTAPHRHTLRTHARTALHAHTYNLFYGSDRCRGGGDEPRACALLPHAAPPAHCTSPATRALSHAGTRGTRLRTRAPHRANISHNRLRTVRGVTLRAALRENRRHCRAPDRVWPPIMPARD